MKPLTVGILGVFIGWMLCLVLIGSALETVLNGDRKLRQANQDLTAQNIACNAGRDALHTELHLISDSLLKVTH